MARQRRTFTAEFKLQMVRLFEKGKSKSDIESNTFSVKWMV